MTETPSTFQTVSHLIAQYVRPLTPGGYGPPIGIADEAGRPLTTNDDFLSGKSLVLLFVRDFADEGAKTELAQYAKAAAELEALNAFVIIVSASSDASKNKAAKKSLGVDWPVLGDAAGVIFGSYGIHKDPAGGLAPALRTVLLTPLRQIRMFLDLPDVKGHAAKMIETLKNAEAASEAQWQAPHAPVLMVPQVFTPEECKALINIFDQNDKLTINRNEWRQSPSDVKIPSYEHNRQDRMDIIIRDQNTNAFIDARLAERVTPMIKKAFSFDVSQREDLHIARYQGSREGNQMGHRDNTNPNTSHRRFALSVSLNDDYEGGELRFQEYSNRGYRTTAGTATVFSSSLLHEVMETTKGTRYVLISHFY
jgi:peroxiredoxin/predicted 2-oxoglutarate/Fe(II)-dependent dioxygenase YbiX